MRSCTDSLRWGITRLAATALAAALAGLCACSGSGGHSTAAVKVRQQPLPPGLPAPAFPSHDQLQRALKLSSVFIDLREDGSEFNSFGANSRVNVNGSAADFSPAYVSGGPASGMAYATYFFQTHDYDGPLSFHVNWDSAPSEGSAFFGLANLSSRRWEWSALPLDGELDFGALSADYSALIGGTIRVTIVTILLTGNAPASLGSIQLGENLPPLPLLAADNTRPLVGQDLQFTTVGSLDHDGEIVKYEYDPDGTGDFIDAGLLDFFNHQYNEAGVFPAAVRVTDNEGATATASLEIKVGWVHNLRSLGAASDFPRAAALDSSGNVYLCGTYDSTPEGAGEDGMLVKYSPDGELLWSRLLASDGAGHDTLMQLGFDSAGFPYSAGYVEGDGNTAKLSLQRIDPSDGEETFQLSWKPDCGIDGVALVVDSEDRATIFGTALDTNSVGAIFGAQVLDDGTEKWQQLWDTFATEDNRAVSDIALDPAGNFYICGNDYTSTNSSHRNGFVLSLEADGSPRWFRAFDSDSHDESFNGLAFSAGQLFVGGEQRFGTDIDALLVRLSADGDLVSSQLYSGPFTDVRIIKLCPDGSGGVYGAGLLTDSAAALDALLLQVDATGSLLSQRSYGQPGTHDQSSGKLSLGADGAIYFTGRTSQFDSVFSPLGASLQEVPAASLSDMADLPSDSELEIFAGEASFKTFAPAASDAGGMFIMRHYD